MQPRNTGLGYEVAVRQATAVHRFPLTGQEIRSILLYGNPWFHGKEIADALKYANPRKAVRDHVPAGHRKGNESFPLSDLGFHPQTVLIDEAGMYRLIMRANTPAAEAFQEWVTAEVLPAIRKTGSYSAQAAPALGTPALDSPADVLALAEAFVATAKRLVLVETRVAELEPGAEAWEALGEGGGNHSLREAAAILSQDPCIRLGQNQLMRYIRDEEMVDSKGRPYARYSKYLVQRPMTYTHPHSGESVLTAQLRVTPAGIAYIRRRLGGIGQEVR